MPKKLTQEERAAKKLKRREYQRELMRKRRAAEAEIAMIEPPPPKRKAKTAIVIAHRNETAENMQMTRDSIAATMPEAVQCWVEDTNGEGCGLVRHRGIQQAKEAGCDVVIITDAHMRFGREALRTMASHVRANPNTLAGCRCYHNPECAFTGALYNGAVISLYARYGTEMVPIVAQWANEQETPTAVMGACYALTIDLYEEIGQPLSILRYWGGDEELLSCCTWFAGGNVEILPVSVAHKAGTGANHRLTMDERARLWANRLNIILALPMTTEQRSKMAGWVSSSNGFSSLSAQKAAEVREDVLSLRAHLEGFGVDPVQFFAACRQAEHGGSNIYTPPSVANRQPAKEKQQEQRERPQIVVVRRSANTVTCNRCGMVNPFRQQRGLVQRGTVACAPLRCQGCGARGQLHVV